MFVGKSKVDGNFSKKIIFSNEVRFQLDVCMNTQNCWFWGAGNVRVIQENPFHAQRATIWCGFRAGGVIGPYFYENEPESAVTLNGVHYRNMIKEFLWPQLDGIDTERKCFQQDGAIRHTALETNVLLREEFPGRVIPRNGDQNWPTRSSDLTPCDFFLGGFVKSRVCQEATNNS
jgi:hypothetical protein